MIKPSGPPSRQPIKCGVVILSEPQRYSQASSTSGPSGLQPVIHSSRRVARMECANKCPRQMFKRFFHPIGLVRVPLPHDKIQHLLSNGVILGTLYFLYLEIFEDLVAFHIVAYLVLSTELINLAHV